ncbi:hypothetical protein KBK24_0121805 [Burkholderia sp. K24]|nr:hypothetical protein KBK24_0121805 [Burkholderia sp. K24]
MDRLIAPNSVVAAQADAAPATGTPQFATDGNPATNVPATQWPAYQYNAIQEELIAILTAAGITPDRTNNSQLAAAIKRLGQKTAVLADTGAVNAYAAVNATPLVAGTWVDGVVQAVKIAHTNTGASTYAPDGLPAIPIYGLGLQPLQGGELLLNGTAILMHATIAGVNTGNPICVLMECAGGAQQVPPATASLHAMQLGQATGRLLRIMRYQLVAGIANVSFDGSAFTTTGAASFTSNAATNRTIVRIQAAGSGAPGAPSNGSSTVSAAPGGSGGSFAEVMFMGAAPFNAAPVTVGAGGAGGGAGLTSSTAGGASTFGSGSLVASCPGGPAISPTPAGSAPLIAGGAISAAAPTTTGGFLLSARRGSGGGFGIVPAQGASGVGGQGGQAGDGGSGPTGSTNAAGTSATNFGAGGAGATQSVANAGALAGGSGLDGYIEVFEYT